MRGIFMKKLTTSILLALFSATIFMPTHVKASWLSKTWKKIEKFWDEAGKQNASTELLYGHQMPKVVSLLKMMEKR